MLAYRWCDLRQTRFRGVVVCVAFVLFAVGSVVAAQPLPEGNGKDIVENRCQKCHGLEDVVASRRNAEEWRKVVGEMIASGATLDAAEIEAVVQYLSTHFGAGNATGTMENTSHIAPTGVMAAQQAPATDAPPRSNRSAQAGPFSGPGSRLVPLPVPDAPVEAETLFVPRVRIVPLVTGLSAPWSIAFLPNGDMLVTERVGRLRIVRNGVLDPRPVPGTPKVAAAGQGGLLDIALHPRFDQNRLVFLTYVKAGEQGFTVALARARLEGETLQDLKDLFVADAWGKGVINYGSRIVFGRDGMIYMTVGDRGDRDRAQDLAVHAGKIIRLSDDGSIPADNPFVGRAGARPEIFAYGVRSPQGLALRPGTNELWETEHGPQGGDELNLIQAGKNYGWPLATFGREYDGGPITDKPIQAGLEPPVTIWLPSIAPSGLTFYSGDVFPEWKGSLFSGGLSGTQIHRMSFNDTNGPRGREVMFVHLRLRFRDVREGPDGMLYAAIDANPGGTVLRIEPISSAPATAQRFLK